MAPPEAATTLARTSFRRPVLEDNVVNAKAGCLYPNNARMLAEVRTKGFGNALVADAMGNKHSCSICQNGHCKSPNGPRKRRSKSMQKARKMFIQTESTPNPATLKFLPGQTVLEMGTADFPSSEGADASPLAARIFAVNGVNGVFFGTDFVTVTKAEDVEWDHIKPALLGAIMEHFQSGQPVMAGGAQAASGHAEHSGEDGEIVGQIKELLDSRVRPAVATRRRRHYIPRFRSRHCLSSYAGCVRGMPVIHTDTENGHRKPVAPLHSRSHRGTPSCRLTATRSRTYRLQGAAIAAPILCVSMPKRRLSPIAIVPIADDGQGLRRLHSRHFRKPLW
ncbi:NifU-like protein 4, mitochondrial [Nymphon striatum]|nr:NifU-like protein 4, mitochondrial [Nymphon striatum]